MVFTSSILGNSEHLKIIAFPYFNFLILYQSALQSLPPIWWLPLKLGCYHVNRMLTSCESFLHILLSFPVLSAINIVISILLLSVTYGILKLLNKEIINIRSTSAVKTYIYGEIWSIQFHFWKPSNLVMVINSHDYPKH